MRVLLLPVVGVLLAATFAFATTEPAVETDAGTEPFGESSATGARLADVPDG